MLHKHPNSSRNILCTMNISGITKYNFICLAKSIEAVFKNLDTSMEKKEKEDDVYHKIYFFQPNMYEKYR